MRSSSHTTGFAAEVPPCIASGHFAAGAEQYTGLGIEPRDQFGGGVGIVDVDAGAMDLDATGSGMDIGFGGLHKSSVG